MVGHASERLIGNSLGLSPRSVPSVATSKCTLVSAPAAHALPQCFLPSTLFKGITGFVKIQTLRVGDIVVGPDGEDRVAQLREYAPVDRDIVDILTQEGVYSATVSHPFCLQGPGGPLVLLAGHLPNNGHLCTSKGIISFTLGRRTVVTAVFAVTFALDLPIYMTTEHHPSNPTFAVCRGSLGSNEFSHGTVGTLLMGETRMRCYSAPARCPETLCLVRLKGRSSRDPSAKELLQALAEKTNHQHLLEAVPRGPLPRSIEGLKPQHAVLQSKYAEKLEKCIELDYRNWRRDWAEIHRGSRAPRLQFQYS